MTVDDKSALAALGIGTIGAISTSLIIFGLIDKDGSLNIKDYFLIPGIIVMSLFVIMLIVGIISAANGGLLVRLKRRLGMHYYTKYIK